MFPGLLVLPHMVSWRREIGCPLCLPVDVMYALQRWWCVTMMGGVYMTSLSAGA